MATTEVVPNPEQSQTAPAAPQGATVNDETGEVTHPVASTSSDLIPEKSTNRGYYKFFPVKDSSGKQVEKDGKLQWTLKIQAKAESADQSNWKKMDEQGWTPFNENDFIRYKVLTEDAIRELIPEAKQRVYLAQSGISYVQNSKTNAFAIEYKDGTGTDPENPPIPVYDAQEIDLKDSINEPPGRRALTEEEKFDKMLLQMGVSDPVLRATMRKSMMAQIAAAKGNAALTEGEEESEETQVAQ